jgi:hypothetical protein
VCTAAIPPRRRERGDKNRAQLTTFIKQPF